MKTINLPTSKSYLQRAILIAAFQKKECSIYYPNYCDDVNYAILAIESLGAKVFKNKDRLDIIPISRLPKRVEIEVGESATLLRILAGIVCFFDIEVSFILKGSLVQRPLDIIVNNLVENGINYCTSNNRLKIIGSSCLDEFKVNCLGSSQFYSGVIIGSVLKQKRCIGKNLVSIQYINLTLDVLEEFGYQLEYISLEKIRYLNQLDFTPKFYAPIDWSGASFFIIYALIKDEINFRIHDTKVNGPDSYIFSFLDKINCHYTIEENLLKIRKIDNLISFDIDFQDMPDLVMPFVIYGLFAEGKSILRNVSRLRIKESNRIESLMNEIGKLNGKIVLKNENLEVYNSRLISADVSSHNDHRIAMTLAIIGKLCSFENQIDNLECINKSFPSFLEILNNL